MMRNLILVLMMSCFFVKPGYAKDYPQKNTQIPSEAPRLGGAPGAAANSRRTRDSATSASPSFLERIGNLFSPQPDPMTTPRRPRAKGHGPAARALDKEVARANRRPTSAK
jgi:hypothetical protein